MVRRTPQPEANREQVLECVQQTCPSCEGWMWNKYDNYRRVRTLEGVVQLRLKVRRCATPECERCCQAYRPEAEGKWALPQQEFGLDVIAYVGALRYQEHRSVPQIHQQLQAKGLSISERTVSNLLARYDELVALRMSERERLQSILAQQSRAILAIDGMQPDVGHEVLWGKSRVFKWRDFISQDDAICDKPGFGAVTEPSQARDKCPDCRRHQ